VVEYSPVWADFAWKTTQARKARRPRLVTSAALGGVWLRLVVPLRTCEKDLQSLCTRIQVGGVVGSGWTRRLKNENMTDAPVTPVILCASMMSSSSST
jgi:hypothetical protein